MIVSIALLGAAFGALFSGNLSDKIGRKKVIVIADLVFAAGSVIMAVAPSISWLIMGRFIIGVGVGFAS